MHLQSIAFAIATVAAGIATAAPLEPSQGQIYLGAWYDRNLTDTPSAVNARIGYKPLSFFQTDIDFSGTDKPWTAPSLTDQFLQQLQDTKTDAFAMLTLYPFQGYDKITDAQIADMGTRLNKLANAGRPVFLRFASEMNGSWFSYGQDPIGFLAAWKRCITAWRKALGANVNKVAFVWSPNSGNGYPFPGNDFSIQTNSTDPKVIANLKALDTNGDGKLDGTDDPYIPYYPGDDYVDWVGISIYHYGTEYDGQYSGWVDNSIPEPDKFEKYLNGYPPQGRYFGYAPLYTYFSSSTGVKDASGAVVSAGNKPMIISETAATYHFAWLNKTGKPTEKPAEPVTPLQIKEAWWNSFMNKAFLSKYPQIKAVSTFEFIKKEEATWRDFTTFGAAPNPLPGSNLTIQNGSVAGAIAAGLRNLSFIAYANVTGSATVSSTSKSDAYVAALAGAIAVTSLFLSL
ncbi:glycoside hydrolase superfamily [Obelidium mucronatum]|nr:glycoside hydrolase superfamily [Obelidium mucronatum]